MSEQSGNTVPIGVYENAVASFKEFKVKYRNAQAQIEALAKERDTIKAERETLATQLAELDTQAKGLKGQLDAQPGELRKTIEHLQGEIRTRDHRDAFYRHAKTWKGEKGEVIRDDALDALWKLSGYTPEGDPDDAKLTEVITAAVAANGFILQTPAQSGGRAAAAANGGQAPAGANGRGNPDLATPPKGLMAQLAETFKSQYVNQ